MILLIEDNPDHAFLLQKALKNISEETLVHLEGGGEALGVIKQKSQEISLLLADVNIDGKMEITHLVNAFQTNAKTKKIPTIIISMNPPNANVEKLLNKFSHLRFVQKTPDQKVLEGNLRAAFQEVVYK